MWMRLGLRMLAATMMTCPRTTIHLTLYLHATRTVYDSAVASSLHTSSVIVVSNGNPSTRSCARFSTSGVHVWCRAMQVWHGHDSLEYMLRYIMYNTAHREHRLVDGRKSRLCSVKSVSVAAAESSVSIGFCYFSFVSMMSPFASHSDRL